jgi:hypothetical protein
MVIRNLAKRGKKSTPAKDFPFIAPANHDNGTYRAGLEA